MIAMIEEEDRIKAEERAMERKSKRARKVQEKEAKKHCIAVFKKGVAVYSRVPTDTEGHFLCKRHNATSLDFMFSL